MSAEQMPPVTAIGQRANLTDVGNAERFACQHGDWVRYCYEWRAWLLWDGRHWRKDPGDGAMRLAKATARRIYEETATEPDDARRQRLAAWAVQSESEKRLRAMLALAQSEPGIAVRPDALDSDPRLLNVDNGTLDLRTGELRPHRREDLLTKIVPVVYDPAATCTLWLATLERIFGGRRPLIDYMQKAIGYALTGDTTEQVLFVFWGGGSNGKTVILTTAVTMLGDYALSTRPETLMAKKGDSIPNDVAQLRGRRLVIAVEADPGQRLAEGLVKQMTDGDVMTARFMHAEFFEFEPTFKLFLGTNHRPAIRGTDHAIWRRIRLIPFTVTIPDDQQDRHLTEKLRAEWPGILAWAVQGCLDWQRDGLGLPDEVKAATETYRIDMDLLGDFLEECCVFEAGATLASSTLYESYDAWAHRNGEKPLSHRAFSLRLAERGLQKRHTERGTVWSGLRFPTPMDAVPDWVT